jgi:branched-chain amino acid transport system ATP-binding protein
MLLKVENLTAYYENIRVLENISIEINKGELVAIIGPNGAGKTTLLKCISGLLKPKTGKIFFENTEITHLSPWERVKLGIITVPEGRRLFPYLTVLENLYVGAYMRKNKDVSNDINEIFKLFPILKERSKQLAGTLSGGEGQMLAIGRGLISKPKLLLMDEPSMGLMPRLVDEIFDVIDKLRKSGLSILLVEQNAIKALSIANRAYMLETGRIVLYGNAKELLNNPLIKKLYLGK